MLKNVLMVFILLTVTFGIGRWFVDDNFILVNVENLGVRDAKDLKLTLYFLDEDERYVSHRFELDGYEKMGILFFPEPELKGWVYASLSNDDYKTSRYFYVS